MNIKPSERKQGNGNQKETKIGYWKGPLLIVNPDSKKMKEIYKLEIEPEEVKYTGTNKNDIDWSMLKFVFLDQLSNSPVEYDLFISKELAEFEQEGITKTWYINQWGERQCVSNESDLFRSFTHMQRYNKDTQEWYDVLDENDSPIKLLYRKAYRGETALYSLLRKLVTQNWYEADTEVNLFLDINKLMKAKVSDINTWIGTDNYQPVIGMIGVETKDGSDGKVYHNSYCIDSAWMPAWKFKEVEVATKSNSWNMYEKKENGKKKNKDIYDFYQAVKKSKYIYEFVPIKTFDPSNHQNATNETFRDESGSTTDSAPVVDTTY